MRICITLYLLCLQTILSAYYSDFNVYQSQYTRDEIDYRIKHFLQKSKEIEDHYLLTDKAFYLFAHREDKLQQRPEFTLKLASSPQNHPPSPFPGSLKNLRIAIDPGHLGGDFAILEQRYVKMVNTRPSTAKEIIFFKEGTLNLLTALLLKQWFEAEGVQVLLTKERDGQAVYNKPFFEWLAVEGYRASPPVIKGIQVAKTLNDLFSLYNRLDLQARADKVNAFQPHLTLIIHYNAHGQRDLFTQENFPENQNYNMAFIGGSFCKGELSTLASRQAFLRFLLTDDLKQSLHLSKYVITQFIEQLNVPPVSEQDHVPYLTSVSLQVDNGIYARNLLLTRLVHGPLCYGESLCQDHAEECILLNEKNLEINGIQGPKRVEQVAQAYYMAVKAFIHSIRHSQLEIPKR